MDHEYHTRISRLEARMHQMEVMMQGLCMRLGIDPAEFTPPEPPENRAIQAALLSGNKIEAIKLYRQFYGVGLREAKDAIDAMEGNFR